MSPDKEKFLEVAAVVVIVVATIFAIGGMVALFWSPDYEEIMSSYGITIPDNYEHTHRIVIERPDWMGDLDFEDTIKVIKDNSIEVGDICISPDMEVNPTHLLKEPADWK